MEKSPHWYLHVDLDAFFASVEQLDNPEYRGKPVIVGGLPDDRRSVVSTASYEARKFALYEIINRLGSFICRHFATKECFYPLVHTIHQYIVVLIHRFYPLVRYTWCEISVGTYIFVFCQS